MHFLSLSQTTTKPSHVRVLKKLFSNENMLRLTLQ